MTNEQIRDFLEKHAEKQFKDFTSSLIPGTDSILGVRLPVLRLLAKQLAKEEWRTYLKEARDDSYEEIMLQGLVIGYVKAEMEELLEYAAAFIPKSTTGQSMMGFVLHLRLSESTGQRCGIF